MSEVIAHRGSFMDTTLHVDDTGGLGRPVVLIHGWPGEVVLTRSAMAWRKGEPKPIV